MARAPIEQPGLRLRLQGEVRRISSQHRQLDFLYGAVIEALESGSARETAEALVRFRDAFDAHARLEDDFYFPAVRGLRPELAPRLEVFTEEHRSVREGFARLEARLAGSGLEGLGEALEAFASELADHEAREEALIAQPGRAPAGRRPAPSRDAAPGSSPSPAGRTGCASSWPRSKPTLRAPSISPAIWASGPSPSTSSTRASRASAAWTCS